MSTVQTTHDTLIQPLEQLKQALAEAAPGREREWAKDTSRPVALLVQALVRRQAAAAGSDGPFAGVDLTRSTLVRQVSALREQLSALLEKTRCLHADLNAAAEAFLPAGGSLTANPLPPLPTSRAIPDFGDLRRAAEQLVQALNRYLEEETKLVLDSVNTEIGVGD
jgi:hypothetical protein